MISSRQICKGDPHEERTSEAHFPFESEAHVTLRYKAPRSSKSSFRCNLGALIIRIGFGLYYTISIMYNKEHPKLYCILKAHAVSTETLNAAAGRGYLWKSWRLDYLVLGFGVGLLMT